MSLYKPKTVYVANEWQLQVPRVVFPSDRRRSTMTLIHGLVKLILFCVGFVALWPQNGSF